MTRPTESAASVYLSQVPLALGLERLAEAHLYPTELNRPVLDLGCGDGLFSRLIFGEVVDYGVDPDLQEIEFARTRMPHPYTNYLNCYGSDMPLPEESVGTVVSNSVLEHIDDLEPVVHEVFRVLKSKGTFLVTLPTDVFERYGLVATALRRLGLLPVERRWRLFYNRFWRHYHAYSLQVWSALFERCGFVVVRSFTYASPGACLRNDVLAPFAAGSKLLKLVANRWVLIPGLRVVMITPFVKLFLRLAEDSGETENGGLVFFEMRKP